MTAAGRNFLLETACDALVDVTVRHVEGRGVLIVEDVVVVVVRVLQDAPLPVSGVQAPGRAVHHGCSALLVLGCTRVHFLDLVEDERGSEDDDNGQHSHNCHRDDVD